ncbi:TPA: NrdH-redoxin [Enterococcus faecalis]|uniref:glutaredoxin domain-containing protein n=1 Tax=Enterococcus faecalis TaxID=1351 RepID=UPI000668A704|nr:glutaredoxin domain-containing protein [Enterococcus faecalis]NSS08803.1 NrdH-redoxin [Enterococcus faecalis]HAP3875996.1 NrdH-redoxin [Enterococcus faecalis]HAP3957093.1 NrdH-redoxin [Enterococcus faecalis]HAP3978643.1 NrdH-redoxin [Enterococcus faecalis]HAP4056907.1 NrdH-redoxin [Enterococcus faecalis]
MSITIFTKPNCQPCKMTKRWLDEKEIYYTELPISDYADILKEAGHMSAPVVQINKDNNDVVTWAGGFNIKNLQEHCLKTSNC